MMLRSEVGLSRALHKAVTSQTPQRVLFSSLHKSRHLEQMLCEPSRPRQLSSYRVNAYTRYSNRKKNLKSHSVSTACFSSKVLAHDNVLYMLQRMQKLNMTLEFLVCVIRLHREPALDVCLPFRTYTSAKFMVLGQ